MLGLSKDMKADPVILFEIRKKTQDAPTSLRSITSIAVEGLYQRGPIPVIHAR